jgi:hypothetical protein
VAERRKFCNKGRGDVCVLGHNINVKGGECCDTVEEKSEKKKHRPKRAIKEIGRGCEEWFHLAHDNCKQLENYSVYFK